MTVSKTSPRGRCYHAIGHAFGASIAEFYRKNPQFLQDEERMEAGVYAMLKLRDRVLAILNEYNITDGPPTDVL